MTHPILGSLTWTEAEDGWVGQHTGFQIVLAHENRTHPPVPLLAYAVEALRQPHRFREALEAAVANCAPHYRPFQQEMAELRYDTLYFSVGKHGRRLFATLTPGREYRAWRLEFRDLVCDGIGFDS